jgi:hypothetical protein
VLAERAKTPLPRRKRKATAGDSRPILDARRSKVSTPA